MLKGITEIFEFIGSWILLIVIGVIFWGIFSFFGYAWKQISLQSCYMFGNCKPLYYNGHKYLAKTTEEPDSDVMKYIDGVVVILNVESNVVHKDFDCPAAKACTKNCIYISENEANLLISHGQARDCKYEFYTKKKCEDICYDTIEKLQDPCINMCIEALYEDKDFSLPEFYFNMAEQSVPDEEDLEEIHSNDI